MFAVLFDRFGPPAVLHIGEVDEPHAGVGEIRVRVRSAGVSPRIGQRGLAAGAVHGDTSEPVLSLIKACGWSPGAARRAGTRIRSFAEVVMAAGSGSSVRALGLAAMIALVAAAGVACGSGTSSKPAHISVAEATQNPCQLVSLSQATAILDPGDVTGNVTAGGKQVIAGISSSCVYGNLSSTVIVSLNFGLLAENYATSGMQNSAGTVFAGHAGVCGADTAKYGEAGEFELAAPIVASPAASAVWLSVDGAPSCAVDAKFAQAVYANL
jgi:hypothetical protein